MNYDFDCSIKLIANDFYEAYIRCTEGKNIETIGNTTILHVVNVPAIVNGSFAIELYLKSMIEKKNIKDHNLYFLFNCLDESMKSKIIREIEPQLINERLKFDEALMKISDSFIYWRYIYEKDNFGIGLNITLKLLNIFIEVIKKYAENKE